jgi:hypothetical protein
MARKVFFSFNFKEDHWRAATVRGIGSVEGNAELSDNDWEAVKKKGDAAVENWIDGQMQGKSCVVVLVGANTANRPWIDYEIKQAWKLKKGLIGIRIHRLLNSLKLSSDELRPAHRARLRGNQQAYRSDFISGESRR